MQTDAGQKWLEVLTGMEDDLDDALANHQKRGVYEVLAGARQFEDD